MPFELAQRGDTQEENNVFQPKFDEKGLVTAVVCDSETNEVVMLAYMNAESLEKTIITGEAHYWSRSRKELWHKGATSGNVQKVVEIRTDCDQDAVLLKVQVTGAQASCHTGRVSCFYRSVKKDGDKFTLKFDDRAPKFDPASVYKK